MFVVSERQVRIRDGKGHEAPMYILGPDVVVKFETLTEEDLSDYFLHCFEDEADAREFAGLPKKQTKKKAAKKKIAKKKAAKRAE